MEAKTYPIGTKIRFINKYWDTNKVGMIVGISNDRGPDIYLPTADKHIINNQHPTLLDGTKFSWHCRWDEIELLALPNQQLEFSFMSE